MLGPQVTQGILDKGYEFIPRDRFQLSSEYHTDLVQFQSEYDRLPVDNHLNDGEGERFRRYARLAIDPKTLQLSRFAHSSFYQSKTFDDLYGDIHREFAPAEESILGNRFFLDLIRSDFAQFPLAKDQKNELFEVSVHIIRIAATQNSEKGRPAPEGIHQDGYHFGAVHLMRRENLTGAQSRVYDLKKNQIDSGYLLQPLDSMLMDDRRIFHAVQPFTAADRSRACYRDILILLFQPLSESPQANARPIPLAV